ncbi:MAG TPA: 2-succinyl-5-enolpyruvyl-6-hydroxy-3-cyclohexene-1-carboxylic-acid synthase [Solirubrobacterales bacterium]|nr:2-succinyl-5-enolpyruvyl-6-hydroxy-3-cyclohexene-1-carboxylic-acid synthase [Solirubrobacterales bacterium]
MSPVDATNRNTALATALVDELARCGVRQAAIAPGSRSTPVALALLRAPAIETVSIVDERSAAFFALGASQATGVPAVVACTSGTATANLHPAICEADEAGVPLIALTSDRPPELRGIGAGQTIDQIALYGGAVRWFSEVGIHEADDDGLLHHRSVACRAFAAAAGDPRPGPVHLNLSWRDPLGPEPQPGEVTASSPLAIDGRGERPLVAVMAAAAAPDDALVDELAARIDAAPRGLIVAGRLTAPAATEVALLAAATGYPILAEPTSQLRLGPHDRTRVISAYEPIARARPDRLAPELVIRFGEMPTCKPLREWLAQLEGIRQIVVDPRHRWNEPTRHAETLVRCGEAALAAVLAERAASPAAGDWLAAWIGAATAADDAIDAELASLDGPSEPALHRRLGRLYRDGEIVYTASSMPIRDQEAFLPAGPGDVRFLANRGANGIDGLVSSGIGAAAASGHATWIVTGDLGLHHDMNGLAVLRDAEPPVRIVVPNNDGGGIFEHLPQAEQVTRGEFESLFGTPLGLGLDRVAAVYDIPFARIDALDDLEALDTSGTSLIEVPVDRRADAALRRRIASAAEGAVLGAVPG